MAKDEGSTGGSIPKFVMLPWSGVGHTKKTTPPVGPNGRTERSLGRMGWDPLERGRWWRRR